MKAWAVDVERDRNPSKVGKPRGRPKWRDRYLPEDIRLLRLVGMDWDQYQISKEMHCSVGTLNNRKARLIDRMECRTTLRAVLIALKEGVLKIEDLFTEEASKAA